MVQYENIGRVATTPVPEGDDLKIELTRVHHTINTAEHTEALASQWIGK
jgi:hypothetical protein